MAGEYRERDGGKDGIFQRAKDLLERLRGGTEKPASKERVKEKSRRERDALRTKVDRIPIGRYKNIRSPPLEYKTAVREISFAGVKLADHNTDVGRAQRALRFRNIAEAVGQRYGIDPLFLLGMIMQESYGDPTQPNEIGDAGLGLIHMQPSMASAYGLDLITDSNKLRDFKQGKKIKEAIDIEDADLKDLIKYDDRFHPIKNIDAAARMLCDSFGKQGWWGALRRYAGRSSYPRRVFGYAALLRSRSFLARTEQDFKKRNPNRSFHQYLSGFADMNRNYGLDEYRKLPKYRPPH